MIKLELSQVGSVIFYIFWEKYNNWETLQPSTWMYQNIENISGKLV